MLKYEVIDRKSSVDNFKKIEIRKKSEQIGLYRSRIDAIKTELNDIAPSLASYNLKLMKLNLALEHHQRLHE